MSTDKKIHLSSEAVKAIQALQHPAGTYSYYRETLNRVASYILYNSDEIGMSDNEAMSTLRALNALQADLGDIAGTQAQLNDPIDSSDDITLPAEPEQLDEDAEAIYDFNNALDRMKQATYILNEAGEHAERAGKEDAIAARMAEVHAHLADAASLIDEIIKCYSIISQKR